MASVKAIGFEDFVLTLGDGATPTEVFTAPCAFAARALNFTKNLNETVVPDCADESKPGWIFRDPLSITWDISGEGMLDEGSIDTWDEWFMQTGAKNVKVTITKSAGSIVYAGAAHLQSFNRTANVREFLMYNVAIAGTGALVRTPPAAGVMSASFLDDADDAAAFIERREANRARRAEAARAEAKPAKGKAKEKAEAV